jgi:adenosine deaminase CECR1
MLAILVLATANNNQYMHDRNQLVSESRAIRFDANTSLSQDEQKAEKLLLELKGEQVNATPFLPGMPFIDAKPAIAKTKLFGILQAMPKGSLLHIHWDSAVDAHWLIQNATYRPNCFFFNSTSDKTTAYGSMRFFSKPPSKGWKLMSELRSASKSIAAFDAKLVKSLIVSPNDFEPDADVWAPFQDYFTHVDGLIRYMPFFRDYFHHFFVNAITRDKVINIEMRSLGEYGGSVVYDLHRQYTEAEQVATLKAISDSVKSEYPLFQGVKLIYNFYRHANEADTRAALKKAIVLRKKYPDTMVGFDLVGHEDPGYTLLHYAPLLLEAQANATAQNTTLPLYLHAGETSWPTNNPAWTPTAAENMYDALLLASRIGHGLAVAKFPYLLEVASKKQICFEICPISNQALQYVQDLRNHPATAMLAAGVPITINPDDPAILGYESVAFDWFEAFVAWDLDLSSLKQLAINSITHSAMTNPEKGIAMKTFAKMWDSWIKSLL